MNIAQIDKTIGECHRFLVLADLACKRIRVEAAEARVVHVTRYTVCASKETAACRRASLDLTRALAELRKR